MDFAAVGSDAWTNGKEYGDETAEAIDKFQKTINEEALRVHASKLRGNRPCSISHEFSVGNFNLVRKVKFDDGVQWIARLRMPPVSHDEMSAQETADMGKKTLFDMQSELATMEFLSQNTDIPIPKVHGYELSTDNAVGCAFSFLEYIHGNTAEEMSQRYPGDHEGIPSQFETKFWRQLAHIMIQLASVRLPKIGSIIHDEKTTGSFLVGPLVETGTGPYESSAEFYSAYPLALNRHLGSATRGQEKALEAFRCIAASFPRPRTDSHAGFGLVNYDLNPNNILVDRDFNVLAVIDWDSVISAPDAALYRFPFLMGVASAVPGIIDTHPAILERQELGRQFAATVAQVGQEQGYSERPRAGKRKKPFLFTKSGFFSKEAVAVRSLTYIKMKQDWVNDEWLAGLTWLCGRDEKAVARFYLEC
ncbi:Protein kinase-like domain protein [Niveomyces insectorum RCEF 264]|uniref:Protein kinase-like domain protein n=1 Tax=Niveomyces insectorum RCEF 264 TaxID=1081102 RepID=A0A167PTH6_9HYPO|nr:Protein kinase-like domain protein [Niveomyces insectorum RCEF 264]